MAKRGPKVQPRHPQADPLCGAPVKPDWLDAIASETWDELVPILTERRVLSRADGTALALLCSEFASWRAAAAALKESGPATETASGSFKPSPELVAVDRHGAALLRWLREFGLTPASRSSVAPIVGVTRDALSDFLARNPALDSDPVAARIKLS